ncbi:hypothetical protein ACPZ19_29215 [Amycolatopsis lurida]
MTGAGEATTTPHHLAAVKVRQLYTNTDGVPREDEGEGTPLFVMSKEEGRWWLAACQNTGVAA